MLYAVNIEKLFSAFEFENKVKFFSMQALNLFLGSAFVGLTRPRMGFSEERFKGGRINVPYNSATYVF